jgi:hypothetical protein
LLQAVSIALRLKTLGGNMDLSKLHMLEELKVGLIDFQGQTPPFFPIGLLVYVNWNN